MAPRGFLKGPTITNPTIDAVPQVSILYSNRPWKKSKLVKVHHGSSLMVTYNNTNQNKPQGDLVIRSAKIQLYFFLVVRLHKLVMACSI